MLFSKRMKISRDFDEWATENKYQKSISNMLVYLQNIGLINKDDLDMESGIEKDIRLEAESLCIKYGLDAVQFVYVKQGQSNVHEEGDAGCGLLCARIQLARAWVNKQDSYANAFHAKDFMQDDDSED